MAKIIVVGANHAGTACIKTMLSASKENKIVVFDRNYNISFLGCGMALWIGNQIKGSEGLFYSNKEELESMGAEVHMETEVENIDFDNKIVYAKTKNGKKISESYDKLVLSTGSLPFIPDIKGKDLKNVQQVKLFQDAKTVIEKLENPEIKNVTVVGAGYIGVELAEAFKLKGKNVSLVDIASTTLSSYYDSNFTELMDKNLTKHGINLELGQKVVEFRGKGKVETVITDKKEIPVDMVVLCIGFKPNTALGSDKIETFKNKAYMVDRHQETNIKDVYAIGDCATIYDNSIDDVNYIALASNAIRTGLVAASNVLEKELEGIGVEGSNGISIYGLNLVSTGITVKKAKDRGMDVDFVDYKDLQKPEFMETKNENTQIRIVFDCKTRVIVGAQMASKYEISMGIHMFSLAVYKKLTIDELKLLDIFFLPHFNKPYNYITMAALKAN